MIENNQKAIEEKWYVINADGLRIGRIASVAAQLLMGKKDVLVRGYHDPRAHVVITNASRIDFTQKRGMTKFYSNYSGFPGGIKFTSLEEAFKKDTDRDNTRINFACLKTTFCFLEDDFV